MEGLLDLNKKIAQIYLIRLWQCFALLVTKKRFHELAVDQLRLFRIYLQDPRSVR